MDEDKDKKDFFTLGLALILTLVGGILIGRTTVENTQLPETITIEENHGY